MNNENLTASAPNFMPEPKNVLILNKIIKVCIYLLVFLIPLWFLPITSNVIDFNKQALMIFLVTLAFILWLAKLLSQGEFTWKENKLNWAILAFLVVYILATIFSLRPYNSLMGFATHLSGSLINILSFVALYILILNNFKGSKEIFKLVFIFLISSAVVAIFGLFQIWGKFILPWDFSKLTSFNTIGTINTLGIFSAVVLILVLTSFSMVKKIGIKIFLTLLGLVNLLILLCLNFWVLWVILGVGMAIILIFGLAGLHRTGGQIGWLVLPMVLLAIALLFILFRPILPLNLDLPIELGLSYKGGWNTIQGVLRERPVLGSGPETFVFNFSKYKPAIINQTAFWNIRFTNPPSEIFSIISDCGVLGILTFLAMIAMFGYLVIKNTFKEGANRLKVGLFGGWLALIVGWFLYPQNLTLIFLFWLLIALLAVDFSVKEKKFDLKTSSKIALVSSFAFVIIILGAVSLLYMEGTRMVAEAKYKKGLDMVQIEGKLDEGTNKVIRATVINPYEDRMYKNLSQLFLTKIRQDLARTDLEQQEKLNMIQVDASNAINSAVRATTLNPQDVTNWIVRGDVYRQVIGFIGGAEKWAEASYEQALILEPLNPFTYTELGRTYVGMADILTPQAGENEEVRKQVIEYLDKAVEAYNKAIEIKSNYSPAHFDLALVFDRQGKTKEAIARMEAIRVLTPQDTGVGFQLAVLYYKDSQFDKAKAEFARTVSLDPNFSNARYFLGLLFDREGDKESAIKQFEKIAELNPDNESIKQILANLRAGQPALGSPELGPPEQPEEVPIEEVPKEGE